LSAFEISRVKLSKHRLELEGIRYGLHFIGQLASEDQSKAVDRVRITPPKRVVRIILERVAVVSPKKTKENRKKAEESSAPPATIVTQLDADRKLQEALKAIFSPGLDDPMIATLPTFWQLYYQAQADHSDYRPLDKAVLRADQVDRKARLLSVFEPPSNEYAQAQAVAGMALYHEGKAGEIAIGRPIGFGLDENAVAAIRKASFEPAIKDGKPVSVLLDLVVQFRIYSKRTAVAAPAAYDSKPAPVLPGPYSVQH
jgi:hypothetical protein